MIEEDLQTLNLTLEDAKGWHGDHQRWRSQEDMIGSMHEDDRG